MADKSFWSNKKDKEWLNNFWYYYRFRILGIGIVLFFVIVGIRQCITRVTPDLTVAVATVAGIPDDVSGSMKKAFSECIDDVDGKDGVVANVLVMNMPSGEASSEYELAVVQQLLMEMTAGESYLYIMDVDKFKENSDSDIFLDISDITGDSTPTYYVDVSDSKFLNNLGFKPENTVCAGVRTIPDSRKDLDYDIKKQKNAKKVLKTILGN